MKKTVITLLAAAFMTAGVFGQADRYKQRQRPQRAQLTEAQQAIGKLMQKDKGIQKIREKAINDMIAYLVKKGHSEKDAKAVVEQGARAAERFRSVGPRGPRGGERQGNEIRAPKNPLTPGWSVKAERKLKRKEKRGE